MTETMSDYAWLAEDIRAFIRISEAAYPPDATNFTIAEQRAFYDRMCQSFDRPHPPGLRSESRVFGGVPCRIYTPEEARAGVTVIYFHGGGFVVGGLHSHDAICAELSASAQVRLIAVDYRLSPENRHPAAYGDACAVVDAIDGNTVLAGDSAGANLAAAVAAHRAGISGQVLIYPVLGGAPSLPSYTRHANAPMLTSADVAYYAAIRFEDPETPADPTSAPLCATDFRHLPPTAIFVAECDPLASDGTEYAARLAEAGVPVALTVEPGLVHGYLRARHMAEGARASFARITSALSDLAIRATQGQ